MNRVYQSEYSSNISSNDFWRRMMSAQSYSSAVTSDSRSLSITPPPTSRMRDEKNGARVESSSYREGGYTLWRITWNWKHSVCVVLFVQNTTHVSREEATLHLMRVFCLLTSIFLHLVWRHIWYKHSSGKLILVPHHLMPLILPRISAKRIWS